jgi:hypothetical protein
METNTVYRGKFMNNIMLQKETGVNRFWVKAAEIGC